MTVPECAALLLVISRVDGGCSNCIGNAMDDLLKRLPSEPWRDALATIPHVPWEEMTDDEGDEDLSKMVDRTWEQIEEQIT